MLTKKNIKLQLEFVLYYFLRFIYIPIALGLEYLKGHVRHFRPYAAEENTQVLVIACDLPHSSQELEAIKDSLRDYAGAARVHVLQLEQSKTWDALRSLLSKSTSRENYSHLLLTYPAALGPRLSSIIRNFKLRRDLKIPIIALLWDIEDPLPNSRILALSSRQTVLASGGNTERQVKLALGRASNAVAPVPELWWSKKRVQSSTQWIDWLDRRYDLLVPSNLYAGRAETVTFVLDYFTLVKFPVKVCSSWIRAEAYFSTYANSRIILNTSRIGASLKMGYPGCSKDFGLRMVGRVVDALVAGAVLVTERCPALRDFGEEGVHYLAYSSPTEAVEKITWCLLDKNLDLARDIASNGQKWVLERIGQSHAWALLDDRLEHAGLPRIRE